MAYDILRATQQSDKQYLKLLYLAARENESAVDQALDQLLKTGQEITVEAVEALLGSEVEVSVVKDVKVSPVVLQDYDNLLSTKEVWQ